MTATTPPVVSLSKPKEIWNTMPGWGIVTNLIPPELIAARKLRVIRRVLAAGIAVIVLLIALAYGWAWRENNAASGDLTSAQDRTTSLLRSQSKYQGSVQIQNEIKTVNGQLAQLLATDVDVSTAVGNIRDALPAGMTIGQLTVTLNKSLTDNAATGNSAAGLDTSGSQHIGTVTLAGKASSLAMVSYYVDKLDAVPGVVQPYPSSNTAADGGVAWTVQLTLTSDLYTHAYDTTKNGGK